MPPKRAATRSATDDSDAKQAKLTTDKKSDGRWMEEADGDVYIYESAPSIGGRAHVAAFDIDGTIITTMSGRTFAKNEHDWKFLYDQVPAKLNDAYEKNNQKLVFFTNQKGISTGKVPLDGFKRKVESICGKIRSPVQVSVTVRLILIDRRCS